VYILRRPSFHRQARAVAYDALESGVPCATRTGELVTYGADEVVICLVLGHQLLEPDLQAQQGSAAGSAGGTKRSLGQHLVRFGVAGVDDGHVTEVDSGVSGIDGDVGGID
jgi:hypothetical protein